MIFYSQGIPWVREMTPGILAYMKKDRVQCRRWESPGLLLHRDVNKILIIDEKKDFAPIISRLRHDADQLCEWVQSEPTYLEVLPLSVSKGSALKLLAGRLGIGLHEVIAIGDHLNDVEMIRQAGLGVAVDNAHPLLKAHARYVAKSHLEHAVAEVIEKFCFM
jgi:Cof subfamily protein (haloacid dehalogenase superfamily)